MLQQRLLANGTGDVGHYLDVLVTDEELAALASALTIGETYFLRQPEHFQVLTRTVLPERLARPDRPRSGADGGPLGPRVLSAGCASGEEAYSLAITLAEAGHPSARITAIDVNPGALAKARAGRYTSWSMRVVPPSVQRRWLAQDGDHFVVNPQLRDAVDFRRRNLAMPDPTFWRPGFDAIFCRNVLMYFAPTVMAEVVRRFAAALMPGGYLFLGSAETLRGLSEEFELCETDGTFYYRLSDSPARPVAAAGRRGPSGADRESFEEVLDLVRAERFGAALGVIERIEAPATPVRSPWDTEVALTRAVLLAHAGDLAGATRDAQRLLGRGGRIAADAHAVLATCRESDADERGALLHWRAAAQADPGFGIAHLHLGRLSRHTGDGVGADRAYERATGLLMTETERRVLLFGGGFDREALLSVCRTMSRGGRS